MEIEYFDNGEYKNMYFPTWSELNGQDDLIWYQAQRIDKNTWFVSVDLNEHYTAGRYFIHFYSEMNGVKTFRYGVSYDIGELKFNK